jgi:hypothetical protein
VTRINYSVGLREGFALPFLFAHFGCVGYLLRKRLNLFQEVVTLVLAFFSATVAVASWQMSPFILAVEVMGLLCMRFADLASPARVSLAKVLSFHYIHFLEVFEAHLHFDLSLNWI